MYALNGINIHVFCIFSAEMELIFRKMTKSAAECGTEKERERALNLILAFGEKEPDFLLFLPLYITLYTLLLG